MSRADQSPFPANFPAELALHARLTLSLECPGEPIPDRVYNLVLAIGQALSDHGYSEFDISYFTDIIDSLIDIEYLIIAEHVTESDRRALITIQDKYVHSHIYLWNKFKSLSDLDEELNAQISVSNIYCAGQIVGAITSGSESAVKVLHSLQTAHARNSKKAVSRRARDAELRSRAKDELRKMWGAGISNSDKAASIVQPKLQQRIGVAIDPEGFPKPSTIRKLIGELAAEQVH